MSLIAQLTENDPHARLVTQLKELDAVYQRASVRERISGTISYPDPDGQTMLKALAEGRALLREYHAARATTAADIGAQTRLEAIAELEAVIAAWRDASDAQWLASRGTGTKQPAQRAVVRRKRAAP